MCTNGGGTLRDVYLFNSLFTRWLIQSDLITDVNSDKPDELIANRSEMSCLRIAEETW